MVLPVSPHPVCGIFSEWACRLSFKGVVTGRSLGMGNLILGNLLGPESVCLLAEKYCVLLCLIDGVGAASLGFCGLAPRLRTVMPADSSNQAFFSYWLWKRFCLSQRF